MNNSSKGDVPSCPCKLRRMCAHTQNTSVAGVLGESWQSGRWLPLFKGSGLQATLQRRTLRRSFQWHVRQTAQQWCCQHPGLLQWYFRQTADRRRTVVRAGLEGNARQTAPHVRLQDATDEPNAPSSIMVNHTHTHTHTDTQTHRHTDTHTQRHADTQTQTHKHTDTLTHRHTDAQTHRHRDTQRHRDTETQRHRDTETHRHRDTHKDPQTQRHTDTHTQTHTHRDTQELADLACPN
jgi:hypothetical protein